MADPTVDPAPAPVFNEAEYLKTQFGDDAPETAAELKTRVDALRANQLTDAQKAQLALFDPARHGGEIMPASEALGAERW